MREIYKLFIITLASICHQISFIHSALHFLTSSLGNCSLLLLAQNWPSYVLDNEMTSSSLENSWLDFNLYVIIIVNDLSIIHLVVKGSVACLGLDISTRLSNLINLGVLDHA